MGLPTARDACVPTGSRGGVGPIRSSCPLAAGTWRKRFRSVANNLNMSIESLERRLKLASDDVSRLQRAIHGEGAYGGVAAETASEEEIETYRELIVQAMKAKRRLKQQLQQLMQQQPSQASLLVEGDAGEL